jgi:hypothetical protein
MLFPRYRSAGQVLATVAICWLVALVASATAWGQAHGEPGCVTARISVPAPDISRSGAADKIALDNFGRRLVPGTPTLPSRIVAIAIPPGAEFVDLSYELGTAQVLPGTYDIAPVALPGVIGADEAELHARLQSTYDENYRATYGTDAPYPREVVEFVRTAGYRRYNLVDVRVMPIVYHPLTRELTYYPDITIDVHYRLPADRSAALIDYQPRQEQFAREFVYNYDQAQDWYGTVTGGSRSQSDYVIITLDSLVSAVQPLVEWETLKGRTVEVVTKSWIQSTYMGYDTAEKIRNFLRDKYPTEAWGIEDVLLVGHRDDLPMRRVQQDTGYGKPETDYYYAELSLPDSASWDYDGDHLYGESSDPIDFYAEVNVGRIPWSDPAKVQHICEKSVAFELNEDPSYKKNILLLGAFFWSDTDNAVLMEMKVNQFWMTNWTKTRLYEKYSGYYSSYDCDYPLSHDNVMQVWPTGKYAFVNWAGHGSPTACYICGMGSPQFISSSDCPALDDEHPSIVFAAACSNSDTDHLNIGQAMMAQGAVGFLGATKVAYGFHAWDDPYDGSTASVDYFFTTCVTSTNYTIGQALQWTLTHMYSHDLWWYPYYETFEWGALWGNPNLSMGPPPFMRIVLLDNVPQFVPPRQELPLNVRVFTGTEEYTPGSALLHYRYDDGEWLTVPLTHVSGEYYQTTLPAPGCSDAPQFYFSAEGSISGLVTCPNGAPGNYFSATVATVSTLLADSFDTHQGWTVHNDISLTSGAWERGIPIGDGQRGDPPTDYDGSGWCYLTGNAPGNSDVDWGPTTLVSPTLNLLGRENPLLTFAYWWYNDDQDGDPLTIELSDDGGASWVLVDVIANIPPGWNRRSLYVTDYVTPTNDVRIRFSAMDYPNDSVTEGAIDAIEIIDITCTPYVPGDLNCDEAVNSYDIDPFVLALSYPDAYLLAYPDCNLLLADCNGDGLVNAFDIDAFVTLLTGQND